MEPDSLNDCPAQAISRGLYMGCSACGRGFHRECVKGCKKCHKGKKNETFSEGSKKNASTTIREPKKLDLRDPKSTGRKRAAELYPIEVGMPCEWKGLRNCGGGRNPIIGCIDGVAKHRHHGPVKDTTRNERGNVHRICTACHVHWHELNDIEYNEKDNNLLPHAPVPAEATDLYQNVLDWKSGEMGRRFKLASSLNKLKVDEDG